MENAQRKSVLFVPASFKEGDINILSAGVNCALFYRSGDSLKSKRVDLCYGGLIVNLVGVHDSSWGDFGRASVASPVDHLLCSKHYQHASL